MAETEARRIEAEAKIASLTLQLASTKEATSKGGNLDTVLETMHEENKTLAASIEALESERDILKTKLSKQKNRDTISEVDENSPLSASEHKLRQNMKEMAAKIANLTETMEGSDSLISQLIPNKDGASIKGAPQSLAERIHAMRSGEPISVATVADTTKTATK